MRTTALTAEGLRALVHYDPETGEFSRLAPGRVRAPHLVNGYLRVVIDGRGHRAHRLAWLHYFGEWPSDQIDHINGIRTDNRISNLREVTNSVNAQNLRGPKKHNRSGYLGVHWVKRDKVFRAKIIVNKKYHYLGSFKDPAAAHQAYLQAKRAMHVGCTI